MGNQNTGFCPYVAKQALQCEVTYRLDEFYRQMSAMANSGTKHRTNFLGSHMHCQANPEQCPRYLDFMAKSNQKQK